MTRPIAAIAVNLVQDIAVLRPFAIIAGRDLGFDVRLMLLPGFRNRHRDPVWSAEIDQLAAEAGASIVFPSDDLDASRYLEKPGFVVSASESHLPQHAESRRLFDLAPSHIVRITVQHGFECPGFMHAPAHDVAYGRSTAFAADVLCGWAPVEMLQAMAPAERRKLVVTGPPAGALPPERRIEGNAILVCENLHSVRYNGTGEALRDRFLAEFNILCEAANAAGREVILRPHPAGRYLARGQAELPRNARIETAPLYRGGLDSVGCAIAPPSSVVIDLLLADIPTAVWNDPKTGFGNRHYRGLFEVADGHDWWKFATAVRANPEPFLAQQRLFLTETKMPTEQAEIHHMLSRLLQSVAQRSPAGCTEPISRS